MRTTGTTERLVNSIRIKPKFENQTYYIKSFRGFIIVPLNSINKTTNYFANSSSDKVGAPGKYKPAFCTSKRNLNTTTTPKTREAPTRPSGTSTTTTTTTTNTGLGTNHLISESKISTSLDDTCTPGVWSGQWSFEAFYKYLGLKNVFQYRMD